jgi:hypothetical protein
MSRENKAITIHGLFLRKGGVLRSCVPEFLQEAGFRAARRFRH